MTAESVWAVQGAQPAPAVSASDSFLPSLSSFRPDRSFLGCLGALGRALTNTHERRGSAPYCSCTTQRAHTGSRRSVKAFTHITRRPLGRSKNAARARGRDCRRNNALYGHRRGRHRRVPPAAHGGRGSEREEQVPHPSPCDRRHARSTKMHSGATSGGRRPQHPRRQGHDRPLKCVRRRPHGMRERAPRCVGEYWVGQWARAKDSSA